MAGKYVKCGSPPKLLGARFCPLPEMMFYLYLPVKLPGMSSVVLPRNLETLGDMLALIEEDCLDDWLYKYVYVTAKRMFVGPGNPGNRPGWHIDGFMSNGDINYIWSDMNPTQFAVQPFMNIPYDDQESMEEIERQVNPEDIQTYTDGDLLRLDEEVVHRVNPEPEPGDRSFVKITVSDHQFASKGNSYNYLLPPYNWKMKKRELERNLDHANTRTNG